MAKCTQCKTAQRLPGKVRCEPCLKFRDAKPAKPEIVEPEIIEPSTETSAMSQWLADKPVGIRMLTRPLR